MQSPAPSSVRRLDVYRLALELVAELAPVSAALGRTDRDLASQLRRAMTSVPLNLCESLRRTGRDRGHLLSIALGSAAEVRAVLDVGRALGALTPESWAALDGKLDRVCAMLFRLRGRP